MESTIPLRSVLAQSFNQEIDESWAHDEVDDKTRLIATGLMLVADAIYALGFAVKERGDANVID
jgi:hypothetical protein